MGVYVILGKFPNNPVIYHLRTHPHTQTDRQTHTHAHTLAYSHTSSNYQFFFSELNKDVGDGWRRAECIYWKIATWSEFRIGGGVKEEGGTPNRRGDGCLPPRDGYCQ